MTSLPKGRVFIEGRYRKLSRDLPQTVFYCPRCKGHPRRRRKCERCQGFGKLTRDSVQELVGWVLGPAFKTRKNKFHGAGREDIDVRMLGRGRPFVMELVNPRVLEVDLAALEAEINRRNEERLEVCGLHWSERGRVRTLKETRHAKEYEALVEIGQEPDPARVEELIGRRVTIEQQTPQRVAHRRAAMVRERWIELRSLQPADEPARWRVRLLTEHGTYVKEAVTGEGGSTSPSLTELLGASCACLALDVVGILDEDGNELPERPAPVSFGRGL